MQKRLLANYELNWTPVSRKTTRVCKHRFFNAAGCQKGLRSYSEKNNFFLLRELSGCKVTVRQTSIWVLYPRPCASFPCVFFVNRKENHKKTRLFIASRFLPNPPIHGKQGKNTQKNIPRKIKTRKSPQEKERKDKGSSIGPSNICVFPRLLVGNDLVAPPMSSGHGGRYLLPTFMVICSVAAFGTGCCWCLDFSHTTHTTSSRCSKPCCQNKRRTSILLKSAQNF